MNLQNAILFIALITTALIGCSNFFSSGGGSDSPDNGGDGSFTVRGSVAGASVQNTMQRSSSVSTADTSDAFFVRVFDAPSVQGLTGVDKHEYWSAINEPRDYPINDSEFEFSIDDGHAFVAVVMRQLDDDRDDAVGVIGIGTGEEEHWHAVDTSLVDGSEIDFGIIDPNSSELDLTLAAENDVHNIGSSVSENTEAIANLARFDDAVRVLVNIANSGAEAFPSFRFLSNEEFGELGGDPGTVGVSDPGEYDYMGYRFVYMPIDVPPDYSDFELYAPEGETIPVVDVGEAIDDYDRIDDTDNPLYAWPRNPGDNDYYYKFSVDRDADNGRLAGFQLLRGVPPDGAWSSREESSDQEFANLYFGMYPPITADDHLQLPIPRISVTTDDDGYLTHISVQWTIWNGLEYEEIDPEVVEPFVSWVGPGLQGLIDEKRLNSGDWSRADSVWDTEFTIKPEGYDEDGDIFVEEKWFLPGVADSDPEGIEVDLIRPAYHFCGFYVELFHQPRVW